ADRPSIVEQPFPAYTARFVGAVLLVIVVACRCQEAMCSEGTLILDEHSQVVARRCLEGSRARDAVIEVVGAGTERMCAGKMEVGLQRRVAPSRVETGDDGLTAGGIAEEIVLVIRALASENGNRPAFCKIDPSAHRGNAFDEIGLIGKRAVVLARAGRIERGRLELCCVPAVPDTNCAGSVLVAVAIRLVGKATATGWEWRAGAGVVTFTADPIAGDA